MQTIFTQVFFRPQTKVVLIGPLPPSWGGARVSFKLFHDYVKENSNPDYVHFDLPIRNDRDKNPPGNVNHFKTFPKILLCALQIPFSSSVIVFGSKNFCFSYGLFLLFVSKLFLKPFYIRFFGGHPAQITLPKIRLLRALIFSPLYLSDRIVVQTHVGAREFPNFLAKKISVVVGYRPMPDDLLKTSRFLDNKIRFVYVGQISPSKGIPCLLKAFKRLKNKFSGGNELELHIYGAGSSQIVEKLQKEKKVHYHGKVDNNTLRNALFLYDIFVFPSLHESEGHPGVIIEALMAGLPIIASDLSGVREIVEPMKNGILFETGNVDRLSEAMQELVENKELRKRLGAGALKSSCAFKTETVLPVLAKQLGIEG